MPVAIRGRIALTLPLLVVTLLLASMLTAPSASATTRQQRVQNAFTIVNDQRGDRYRYGAEGPDRFDCSGLIYFSFRKAGFDRVPRTSSAQARHARRISKSQLRRGDLMFFHNGAAVAGNVYHVGVFAGWNNGRRHIVHSPSTGSRVHRSALWTSRWFAGTLR